MKIPQAAFNFKILRKIKKLDRFYLSYENAIKWRTSVKSFEKPKNMSSSLKKISVLLPYTFEKYETIHNIIINKFKKSGFSSYIKNLPDSSKVIDNTGWNNLGFIVPKNIKNPYIKLNSLVVNNIPIGTTVIECYIYRLLPSTYVLCFDFHLDKSFQNDLYFEFYSKNDVTVKSYNFFKNRTIETLSSKEKYTQKLDSRTKELKLWLLEFFGFKEEYFISTGTATFNELKNLLPLRTNDEIIQSNRNFFETQSIGTSSLSTFSNNNTIFSIENLMDFRFYQFDMNNEHIINSNSDFIRAILILSIITNYKKTLEDTRRKNINSNKNTNILELKNETLKISNISFQIYRFFQEIKFYHIESNISRVQKNNFTCTTIPQIHEPLEFSEYANNFIKYYEKILTENSNSINSVIDKELNASVTETNYSLQKKMMYLTYAALFIAFLSLAIAAVTADPNKTEDNYKLLINSLNKYGEILIS